MTSLAPQKPPACKLGLLVNSIGVFNAPAKDRSEQLLRGWFDEAVRGGAIHPESIITPRLFGPHEALQAADRFAEARVDLVVIANVAFPNGQVLLTLATHPHLARTPLAIVAEPEPAGVEWATNAWCGVIMNNHVARQLERPIATIPGPFDCPAFREEMSRLLRVAAAIAALRRQTVCRFGDAPGGFHSATGDQVAFAKIFGTRVETVDLTALIDAYRSGKATGLLGEQTFSDDDVRQTAAQLTAGRQVQVDAAMIDRAARLYHAYRAILRAGGYTAAAMRCWPEMNEPYIGVSSCAAMGLLLANGDVTAAACESDWPTAVAQSLATMLSGAPAACLDWVNYTTGSEVVQLGHCGVGICGRMTPGQCAGAPSDALALHPVIRQGGGTMGPVLVGQFEFGPKTGLCLTRDPDGRFKLLAFGGQSNKESARGLCYSAVDMVVPDPVRLDRLVLEGGFPHHLAVALGDIRHETRLACKFLGVEYLDPED